MIEKLNMSLISTQSEVLDFPKQYEFHGSVSLLTYYSRPVITRDNATAYLDAILSYQITNPKLMIYSCNNLPDMLSKMLQASLRNVAGALELDQIIEDTGTTVLFVERT